MTECDGMRLTKKLQTSHLM